MAETFLALHAYLISGDILLRVVYSPPNTHSVRMRRKANDVSEDEETFEDRSGDRDEEDGDAHDTSTEDVLAIREINMGLVGVLSLHYQTRDVRIPVDGDSAMRILTMFKTRSDERWKDDLDPRWSSAASGWVVLDIQQLLAMSYCPQTPPRERTAVDPQ